MTSFSLNGYNLPVQQFQNRFRQNRQLDDIFSRGYKQCLDLQTNKRVILKSYSIQTPDKQQVVLQNLQNFAKLNKIDGICKFIAYTTAESHTELTSAFQYDLMTLGEYIKIIKSESVGLIDRQQIYLDVLAQICKIINTGVQIGIQFDQISRQTIVVKESPFIQPATSSTSSIQAHPMTHILNLFYDEREKQYGKIQTNMLKLSNNNKIYWSADKIENQILRGRQYSMQEGQQSIYQLGLMLLDIVYQIQSSYAQKTNSQAQQKAEHLMPDQIAIHSQNAMSYYQIYKQQNRVERNQILVSHRLNYLISSSNDFLKQLGIIIKSMIVLMAQARPNMLKIQNQCKRLQDTIQSSRFMKTPQKYNQTPINVIIKANQSINNSLKSITQQMVHLQSTQTLKDIPSVAVNNTSYQMGYKMSQNSIGQHNQQQRQLMQNAFKRNINSSPSPVPYRKQAANMPLSATTITSDANTNKLMQRFSGYQSNRGTVKTQSPFETHQAQHNRNTVSANEHISQMQYQFLSPAQLSQFTKVHHEGLKKLLARAINQISQIKKVQPYKVIKKQYIDSSLYYGCIDKDGKKEGLGVYIYKLSDIYFGVWKNNSLTNGTYLFKNGQSFQGTVLKGGKQGPGVYRYANGNIYDGMWKDDLKNGKGIMVYPTGAKYEGQWMKGKKHGQGIYFYENGTQFRGGFALGKKYGNGVFLFPNGTKVQGFWDNNHLQGLAKIFYYNGDYYEGNLHMSQKSGQGIYRWNNLEEGQIQYKGQFKKDNLQGLAIIKFRNGQIYEGRVQNGRRDGQGSYKYSNGDQFIGQWKNDEKQVGKYIFSTGEEFEGKFKNGQMSFGTMKYSNGQIYQGQFFKGERNGVGTYSNKLGQVVYEGHWEKDQYMSNKKN